MGLVFLRQRNSGNVTQVSGFTLINLQNATQVQTNIALVGNFFSLPPIAPP
jgi:hypothetical protein